MKHSFSILLVSCVLMVIGAALVPQLDISNKPRPEQVKTLTISYRWKTASAKGVEQNVTSRIEAMVSSVRGVEKVSSVSRFGNGRITVELKPKADVSATKFEIASILRQIRGKLPESVSYPTVSGGEVSTALGDDNEVKLILTYMLNADMSGEQMRQIAEKEAKYAVERIEGVHHVDITGTVSHYMEVEYDAEQLALYGIGSSDIIDAIRNFSGREDVLGEVLTENGKVVVPLLLSSKEERRRFEQMPLKNIDGKIVYLYANDATAQYNYIKSANDKGYNVLLLDGQLDSHFVGLLERKLENTELVRVDSDVVDNLIRKSERRGAGLSALDTAILSQLFESVTRKVEKTGFTVSFEALAPSAQPVVLTQNEYMRRMKEMAAMQPGMNFYAELPDNYSLVVNTEHPLVKAITERADKALVSAVKPLLDSIEADNQAADDIRKAAPEGKLSAEDEQRVKDLEKKVADAREQQQKAIAEYAGSVPEVSQLVDLALLGNGLLKGRNLSDFIARSVEMMK